MAQWLEEVKEEVIRGMSGGALIGPDGLGGCEVTAWKPGEVARNVRKVKKYSAERQKNKAARKARRKSRG